MERRGGVVKDRPQVPERFVMAALAECGGAASQVRRGQERAPVHHEQPLLGLREQLLYVLGSPEARTPAQR
jgi:hypothetical protein